MNKEWQITDPDTNQMYQEIKEGEIYLFKEDRLINPETGEKEVYESLMDINEYLWKDIIRACEAYGYEATTVDKWLNEGEEIPLILECLFELEVD